MKISEDARVLDTICYQLVLSDLVRGSDRARIANLANGVPPYTQAETEDNQIVVNINDLSHCRLMHEARAQLSNAFLKTGNFFTCRTDMGPKHKRSLYGSIVTKEIARRMKRSVPYFERVRAKLGLLVLHGISPGCWENEDKWCSKPLGVEDVLIPGRTLLGFENLPIFVLRRSFTAVELKKATMTAKRDPGWNVDFVNRALKWIDEQSRTLYGNIWPEIWAPEKWAERQKEDAGCYSMDQVPKINTFDCYIYDDSGGTEGWLRRIILDNWSTPTIDASATSLTRQNKGDPWDNVTEFLFTSGERKFASSWQNIIALQYADLSAIFPARYHSVRSLGWLMYASCHLKNRVQCKFYEAVLEALQPYFKVKTMDDVQRALKLDLVTRGFIDDTITPLTASERWQVNTPLVELGQQQIDQTIRQNSSSYVQNTEMSQDRTEKTRFQVMAELNAVTALVTAALNQAYQYESFEDREIFRRFMRANSRDNDVREARNAILSQGVPEKLLVPDYWDIEHERIAGGGSKTMEMTIAGQLMEWRDKFDPEPQRKILRSAVLALTDDAAEALELVPDNPVKVTDAVHDAQNSIGSLMAMEDMEPLTGENHVEIVETLIKSLDVRVAQILQSGGMTDQQTLAGLANIAKYVHKHVDIIAQDKTEKARVKVYMDALGIVENHLKAFAQRLQEAMQQQAQAAQEANGNGQPKPEDIAKVQAIQMQAQVKAQNARESHAQKTAQRAITFEEKTRQDQAKTQAEIAAKDLLTAGEIQRQRLKAAEEPKDEE